MSMKLKYSICCGLDVHKNVIVATIVTTNKEGISEYNQQSFSTINSDIQRFHDWLIENNCYHVCMESTGKYWIPIFNYLENDIDVCLTHPKYVKAIKGKKTDKKDSKWIADLYKFDLVRCSFIPPKDFRQLRELARYRFYGSYPEGVSFAILLMNILSPYIEKWTAKRPLGAKRVKGGTK